MRNQLGMKGAVVLAMAMAAAIAGCVSPYGQNVGYGGFNETVFDKHRVEVRYDGNGHTAKDQVWNYWFYRCAEITKQHGFTYFTLEKPAAATPATGTSTPAPAKSGYRVFGNDGQSGRVLLMGDGVYRPDSPPSSGGAPTQIKVAHGGGGGGYTYVPGGGGGTITTWHTDAIVTMYNEVQPELVFAFDADSVMKDLGPYVKAEGAIAPPVQADVLKGATKAGDLMRTYMQFAVPVWGSMAPPGKPPTDSALTLERVRFVSLFPIPTSWTRVDDGIYLLDQSVKTGPIGHVNYVIATTVLPPSVPRVYRFDHYEVQCDTQQFRRVAGGTAGQNDYEQMPANADAAAPGLAGGPADPFTKRACVAAGYK